MKILIATTSAAVAQDLRVLLEREGHEIVVSPVSGKVIDEVYINTPDLLFLDIALSRPSVCDMVSKLKSAPSTRDIPILIISGKRSFKKVARCYKLGAYDYISKPFFKEEIMARMGNIGYVSEKMKEVEKLLVRDYLTGIYNRKFFMERLMEELAWADRYHEPLSFIILDIDHFKKINDTYGHSCGDVVLKQLAQILTSVLRAHDVLARYGGEEFVILLSNTNEQEAFTIGEKLRNAVQAEDFYCEEGSRKLPITISLGVATAADMNNLSPESLINRADAALYQAKAGGRNRVVSDEGGGPGTVHEG
jgi:two-component system, cell cycle response regulator